MRSSKLSNVCLHAVLTLLVGSPALADDTEVFFGTTSTVSAGDPNILLVLDTSGSMTRTVTTRDPYDASTAYAVVGTCDSTRVYFKEASGNTATNCSDLESVPLSTFSCPAAVTAFSGVGYYQDSGIRWTRVRGGSDYSWSRRVENNRGTDYVTCLSANGSSYYPYSGSSATLADYDNGSSADNYWTSGSRRDVIFYSANYINYLNSPAVSSNTRMQIVKDAAKSLVDSVTGVNIGLMRYDSNGAGGMVVYPVTPVATAATDVKSAVDAMNACGVTPLSETLYEANLYFKGGAVDFGNSSYSGDSACDNVETHSVAASRTPATVDGTNYRSPITQSCQKSHIVYLTDGLANGDNDADSDIDALAGTTCYSSQTNMWTTLGVTEPTDTHSGGLCLRAIAKHMYENDVSSLAENQYVNTHFIGFGSDVAGGSAQAYLRDAARAGGGDAYSATDYSSLVTVLQRIIAAIKDDSASFTSPSVAVNSFNKTQILEDLYVSMFKPTAETHWPGNIKKFKLRDGKIVGRGDTITTVDSVSAVDPATGFFTNTSRDFWHQDSDATTDSTTKGGAARRIPTASTRNLYTYIGPSSVAAPVALSGHPVNTSNTAIDDTVLNIGGASDPSRSVLINWARGDEDGDLTTTGDQRFEMGDPIHSQPAVVVYAHTGSTTTEKLNDAVVFAATNDGYVHAVDVLSGTELWSYIPQELLPDLKNLYFDGTSATKHYSLDGSIRVLRYDADNSSDIDASTNDRVYLFLGQGRGGDRYYALDVTNKNNPKFAWSLGASDLGGIVDKSWSTPVLGRIKVGTGSGQNSQRLVLIFAAGYDDGEDSQSYNPSGNTYGRGIFVVDAIKGTVLASKTYAASGAFSKMTHAIPSDMTVLDTDNDGWTDRMYVGDMAGQVWRFDIQNGKLASDTGDDSLISGGVIASLGAKAEATPSVANNRSFYNAPDVALMVTPGGSNFYSVAIGSGDRALPRSNTTTQDRFYAIRDYNLGPMLQSTYDSFVAAVETDLVTIDGTTLPTLPAGGKGWKLPLSATEKALARSITVDGTVLFTTYLPTATSTGCSVSTGQSRSYGINVVAGLKRFSNLYEQFNTSGLPTEISIVNQDHIVRTDGTTATPPTTPPSSTTTGTCLSGVTILGNCVNFGSRVRTFWRDAGAN